ncbi:MAG: DNA-binding protein [Comamonas sp.]
MNTDHAIQADIEALRARFADTKTLYREVCGLLFFRYGITPTASRLYQLVRKGSMGTPAQALATFWEDLRSKSKVEIEHPDLPPALRQTAGELVQSLWGQALEQAREELAAVRAEARQQAEDARAGLAAALDAHQQLEQRLAASRQALQNLERERDAAHDALESERRAHAATTALAQSLARQKDELKQDLARTTEAFRAELEKGREAINRAAQRAVDAEHRALREIDQARTARLAAEKQLEGLRQQSAQAERRHHAEIASLTAAQGQLGAERDALQAQSAQWRAGQQQIADLDAQLQSARQTAAEHKSEAQALRGLLDKLAPPGAAGKARRLPRFPRRG